LYIISHNWENSAAAAKIGECQQNPPQPTNLYSQFFIIFKPKMNPNDTPDEQKRAQAVLLHNSLAKRPEKIRKPFCVGVADLFFVIAGSQYPQFFGDPEVEKQVREILEKYSHKICDKIAICGEMYPDKVETEDNNTNSVNSSRLPKVELKKAPRVNSNKSPRDSKSSDDSSSSSKSSNKTRTNITRSSLKVSGKPLTSTMLDKYVRTISEHVMDHQGDNDVPWAFFEKQPAFNTGEFSGLPRPKKWLQRPADRVVETPSVLDLLSSKIDVKKARVMKVTDARGKQKKIKISLCSLVFRHLTADQIITCVKGEWPRQFP
jgi:hypothetical protein